MDFGQDLIVGIGVRVFLARAGLLRPQRAESSGERKEKGEKKCRDTQ